MKTILLLRHGKSDWGDPDLEDFERPLSPRGKKDAPRMGKVLLQYNLLPDLIVSSPAERAKQTARRIATACGYTEEVLFEELDDRRIQIAQVGTAGERLVKFAAIMNMANRAHGRTGMGAVMGSKNLKAVVVRGSKKKLPVADKERLRTLMKRFQPNIRGDSDVRSLGKLGTAGIIQSQECRFDKNISVGFIPKLAPFCHPYSDYSDISHVILL